MKYLLLSLFVSSTVQAASLFRFLPMNLNAIVVVHGNSDNDFADFYKAFNVPEQDTSFGKGKGYKTADKALNITCSVDKVMCQVVVNKSARVVIDPAKKYMSFTATGAEAEVLAHLFVKNSKGEVDFSTGDKLLRIRANATGFKFEASENGLSN